MLRACFHRSFSFSLRNKVHSSSSNYFCPYVFLFFFLTLFLFFCSPLLFSFQSENFFSYQWIWLLKNSHRSLKNNLYFCVNLRKSVCASCQRLIKIDVAFSLFAFLPQFFLRSDSSAHWCDRWVCDVMCTNVSVLLKMILKNSKNPQCSFILAQLNIHTLDGRRLYLKIPSK